MVGGVAKNRVSQCCLLTSGLLVLTLLSACGQVPAIPTVPVQALPSALPLSLNTRSEGVVSTPCGPLWPEDEQVILRGLYRVAGKDGYLDVTRISMDEPACWARFFLDQDLGLGEVDWGNPAYVEVIGLPSSSRWGTAGLWDVQVGERTVLSRDLATARAACRQAVVEQTTALQELDWSSLALPAYVTGTAGFQPSAAELADVTVDLTGADDRSALVLLTAKGPDLPPVKPLVTRWVSIECVYDGTQQQVVRIVATIRGEVQE